MVIKRVLIKFIMFALFISVLVGSLIFFRLLFLYQETKSVDLTDISLYETTKIYDANRELITTLGVEQREIISYNEISPHMIDALISIEDNQFFEHKGIDPKRMFSALLSNLKSKSYQEGASTISQQLIKLEFLTTDKTLERKVKEAFLSMRLEKIYEKEEILEMYLNRVLFGGRIYGIENASLYYFNKQAKSLNYEEAALLAGIIQSPNRFNPYTNETETKNRQIQVLNQMLENDKITIEDHQLAVDKALSEILATQEEPEEQKLYHEYIDYVIYEITHIYKLDPFADSLKIYTNLDTKAQDHVTKLEKDPSNFKDDQVKSGMVVIETRTGKIRAIGGGRNYDASMQFNYATDARIQPGSTIKPILDYGPAIEYLNYSPGTPLVDEKIYYETLGSRYMPIQNYDKRYKGTMTLRDALIDSRNVPAVKVFREVGSEQAYQFASNLGLEFTDLKTEANALGGFEHGFSVLTMAAAYSAFANNGYYTVPTAINQIYHEDEDITLTQSSKKVMREETSYLMTDILHDNMETGTAYRANVPGLYMAGKTGQTNFDSRTQSQFEIPSNAVRDTWFIGYTSEYTTAVWVGYDQIAKDHYLTPLEAKVSLDLFKQVMKPLHEDLETTKPETPNTIVEVEVEVGTTPLMRPSLYTPSSFKSRELFIEGYEPKEISSKFKPLKAPDNLFVYYDDSKQKVVMSWNKSLYDYGSNEYSVMTHTHTINKFYDNQKDQLLYEFYNDKANFPTYIKNDAMKRKISDYCKEQITGQCPSLSQLTYNQHIAFLTELNTYEVNKTLKSHENLQLLTEAEMSDLLTMKQRLGQIDYTITFHNGLIDQVVYTGPYHNQIEVDLSFEAFSQFSSFSISCDYHKYRYRLASNKATLFNPFYSIF